MKILFNKDLDDLSLIKNALIKQGYSENDLNEALKEIQKCDLSPGLNYKKIKYIEPDLKIVLIDDAIKVNFINESFPVIKTDDVLITQVKKEFNINKNPDMLKKINEAKWLLKSVKTFLKF